MTDTAKFNHGIKQPKLKELGPNERVVRTAGLKFILPNNWKAGDILDEQSAAFINTAWATFVLNRFSPIRDNVLEQPCPTYTDLDRALQATFEDAKWTPRPARPPSDTELLDNEDRALISYARSEFNKRFGGKSIPRKDYEKKLRDFVLENKPILLASMQRENAAMKRAMDALDRMGRNA